MFEAIWETKVDMTSLFDAVETELAPDSERPGCKFQLQYLLVV